MVRLFHHSSVREVQKANSKRKVLQRKRFERIYIYPAGNYMFKVNNRNTRTRCETCSKLTIKTPERRHWRHRYGVFIVNLKHILHFFLVFLLLTLSKHSVHWGINPHLNPLKNTTPSFVPSLRFDHIAIHQLNVNGKFIVVPLFTWDNNMFYNCQ